jgi:hypothetical protein
MISTKIVIHGPMRIMGEDEYHIHRDTVELDAEGNLVRFVGREHLGITKNPILTRDVEADLDRYGKIASWR